MQKAFAGIAESNASSIAAANVMKAPRMMSSPLSLYDLAPGGASFLNYSILSQHRGASQILERLPITWNPMIDKESPKIKMLEQVLIEKIRQLFCNML
ncbi:MAG: hypothetical protein ACR65T_03995 [Methylocystis sp.]|uniref:hypothetical protein n=1 Tax=Methylocystis sp. TaxID=1911079 RepID=UPI003DA6095D